MVEHCSAVVRVEFWRGALIQNERALAIFLRGGCNNHPFGFHRQWLDLPFSIFHLNIFEFAVAVFLRCRGFKNEHDGDHYLDTHSLTTSNSNNTHREWLRSLFCISRRARDNGVSLEMRWTGDTITISQSVVVVETQLQIHLFPFGLKVMYDLMQQWNCWSLPAVWREPLRFWTIISDYSSIILNKDETILPLTLLLHESWVKYAVDLLGLDKITLSPTEVTSFDKEKAHNLLRKLEVRYRSHINTRINDTSKCNHWVLMLAYKKLPVVAVCMILSHHLAMDIKCLGKLSCLLAPNANAFILVLTTVR